MRNISAFKARQKMKVEIPFEKILPKLNRVFRIGFFYSVNDVTNRSSVQKVQHRKTDLENPDNAEFFNCSNRKKMRPGSNDFSG